MTDKKKGLVVGVLTGATTTCLAMLAGIFTPGWWLVIAACLVAGVIQGRWADR